MAVLAVGCGSSNDGEFISTGNGGFVTTGSLSYLLQVNNVTSVPNGTASLRFDLFDNQNPANGNLVLTTDAALSDTVQVDDLPQNVQSTVVTAFDADGNPIGQVTVNSNVVAGANGQIDLSNIVFTAITYDSLTATPDPVDIANDETQALALTAAFSNQTTSVLAANTFATDATFVSGDSDVATVDANGVISTAGVGNTTVTASYTINGVSQSDTVAVNVSSFNVTANFIVNARVAGPIQNGFDDWPVEVGQSRQPQYVTQLTRSDNQTETIAATDLSFAFVPPVTGFSVSSTGEVSVASTVSGGTTANLVVSYTDSSNRTFTDVMIITALVDD